MAVGTNIGNVYKSSEGFGKSAILPQQQNAFAKESVIAQNALNPKTPVVDKNAILKELKDGKAEWWIAHNADLEKEFNTLLDYGADIMEQNVDPTKNPSDKAAADWQARWAKLENAAKLSMQAKEDFEAFKAVADKEPDKYTDESLAERYAFHARPFSEMKEDYGTPPRLVSKQAPYEYTKNLQTQAKNFADTNKAWQDDPAEVERQARIAFSDKSMNPGIIDALKPRIDKLTPAEKAELEQLAGTAGFGSPEEYLYAKDFESQLGEKVVPFDLNKVIKESMPGYDITGRTKETPDNFKTTSVQTEEITPKRAEERARFMIEKGDPYLLDKMIKNGSAADADSAVEVLKQGYLTAAKRSKVTSETYNGAGYEGSGYGKEEVEEDWKLYDRAIRAEVNEFDGKKLTPRQKRVARNVTGSYVDGVDFGGGKIVDMVEGKEYKTMGSGKTAIPGSGGYESVPILIRKKTGSKSVRKGTETVQEDVYDIEQKDYTIYDNDRGDHLEPGTTKELYAGGIKQRKELFRETLRRALEEDAKLEKMELSGDYIKAQQDAEKNKTKTTPDEGEFDNY